MNLKRYLSRLSIVEFLLGFQNVRWAFGTYLTLGHKLLILTICTPCTNRLLVTKECCLRTYAGRGYQFKICPAISIVVAIVFDIWFMPITLFNQIILIKHEFNLCHNKITAKCRPLPSFCIKFLLNEEIFGSFLSRTRHEK